MSLAIWILATTGSALVLTQSTITAPFRNGFTKASKFLANISASPVAEDHGAYGVVFPTRRPRAARAAIVPAWLFAIVAKLINCPMCSGFWLGMGWAWYLIGRGALSPFRGAAWAYGFGGSIASALAVAAWILLQEAHQALALWRYNHPPRDGS